MADEESKGYRVNDRRFKFDLGEAAAGPNKTEGQPEGKDAAGGEAAPAESEAAAGQPEQAAGAGPQESAMPEGATPESAAGERRAGPLPPITFATFIFSLNTSALIHLGEYPDPVTGTERDIDLAKQTIDLLGMLKEKTRGNLTSEEERMLDAFLFDLRMRFLRLKG